LRVYETGAAATSDSPGANYSRVSLMAVSGAAAQITTEAAGTGTRRNLTIGAPQISIAGLLMPQQFTTATRPAWTNGAVIFDTDLDKLVIGGSAAWEAVTSV
jgi:hypothetical protein